MLIVTLPSSAPPSYPVPAENPDVDFERRWKAWKARGLAHERTVQRRFLIVAIVTAAMAVAVLVAYGLLSS